MPSYPVGMSCYQTLRIPQDNPFRWFQQLASSHPRSRFLTVSLRLFIIVDYKTIKPATTKIWQGTNIKFAPTGPQVKLRKLYHAPQKKGQFENSFLMPLISPAHPHVHSQFWPCARHPAPPPPATGVRNSSWNNRPSCQERWGNIWSKPQVGYRTLTPPSRARGHLEKISLAGALRAAFQTRPRAFQTSKSAESSPAMGRVEPC